MSSWQGRRRRTARHGGQLALGTGAYFGGNGPLRMVRIGAVSYIALTGCAPGACNTHRVLLLIRATADQRSSPGSTKAASRTTTDTAAKT